MLIKLEHILKCQCGPILFLVCAFFYIHKGKEIHFSMYGNKVAMCLSLNSLLKKIKKSHHVLNPCRNVPLLDIVAALTLEDGSH